MGKVIVFTNLKGGVGKTTDTNMVALVASQIFNKKVLLIDVDLQANSTQNMSRTFGVSDYPKSFTQAIMDGTFKGAIKKLSKNLDFIAGSAGTHDLNEFILNHAKTKKERYTFLQKFVDEVKDDYDYIFFDVAPSTDNTVDAIVMVSDYIVPVQEVKRFSMDGTNMLIDTYLKPIIKAYPEESKFQIAGILPAIFQRRMKYQETNYEETLKTYGKENVFTSLLRSHVRLEKFGERGITLTDYEDRKIWAIFCDLFQELEARIDSFEKTGDVENFEYELEYYDTDKNKILPKGKELKLNGIITE